MKRLRRAPALCRSGISFPRTFLQRSESIKQEITERRESARCQRKSSNSKRSRACSQTTSSYRKRSASPKSQPSRRGTEVALDAADEGRSRRVVVLAERRTSDGPPGARDMVSQRPCHPDLESRSERSIQRRPRRRRRARLRIGGDEVFSTRVLRSLQPALGMLGPRRLGHSQNPSPQDPAQFSDTL